MTKLGDVLNDDNKNKLERVKKDARMNNRRTFVKDERPQHPTKLENGLPYATKFYPTHLVKIALLIKNNAEFRRMISLAIRHKLVMDGICHPDDKVYINYYWNKYSISINGLKREEFYSNELFANCFATANNLFTSYTMNILENYLGREFGKDILDYNEIETMTSELKDTISQNVNEQSDENGRE